MNRPAASYKKSRSSSGPFRQATAPRVFATAITVAALLSANLALILVAYTSLPFHDTDHLRRDVVGHELLPGRAMSGDHHEPQQRIARFASENVATKKDGDGDGNGNGNGDGNGDGNGGAIPFPPPHPHFLHLPYHSIQRAWENGIFSSLALPAAPVVNDDDNDDKKKIRLPPCHDMTSDVRIAVIAGHGYKTLRARASYVSWGRCVHPSRITYYSEEEMGRGDGVGDDDDDNDDDDVIPTDLVQILNDTSALPYHIMSIQRHECSNGEFRGGSSSSVMDADPPPEWLFVVGVDTYVNLRNLSVAISQISSKLRPNDTAVLAGDLKRYYPDAQMYVPLAGGILMSRFAVERALCKIKYSKYSHNRDGDKGGKTNCRLDETSNMAAGLARCLQTILEQQSLVLHRDGRFNVRFDDHGKVEGGNDGTVSVGYLDPPSMLVLGGIHAANPALYDRVLGSGYHDPDLDGRDVFVMTITGQSVEWRARAVQNSWFRWTANGTARFFSEVYDPEFDTVRLPNAIKGHAGAAKVQMILRWVYENEVYRLPQGGGGGGGGSSSSGDAASGPFKHKWYVMTDDDTYIRFPRLVQFLRHYDSRIPIYMGRCQYVDGTWDTALGGPGIVLSAAAMDRLKTLFLNDANPGSYGDMWIGLKTSRGDVKCTDESIFYDRAPAELPDDLSRVEHSVTFHMSAREIPDLFQNDVRNYTDLALS